MIFFRIFFSFPRKLNFFSDTCKSTIITFRLDSSSFFFFFFSPTFVCHLLPSTDFEIYSSDFHANTVLLHSLRELGHPLRRRIRKNSAYLLRPRAPVHALIHNRESGASHACELRPNCNDSALMYVCTHVHTCGDARCVAYRRSLSA